MTRLPAGSPATSTKGSRAYASVQEEGASLLFPPELGIEQDLAAAQVQGVLHRSPLLYEQSRSRWCLAGIGQAVRWMRRLSLSGVWRLLKRLGLSYKRGQRHVHSPDPL